MNKPTCEICGDVVTDPVAALECGHTVHLCEVCKRQCPGALRLCVKCEDGEYDDPPHYTLEGDDEVWGSRGSMHDADDEAMERWADRYDELNGGPEDDEDR